MASDEERRTEAALRLPWRVGRHVGRTVYVCGGTDRDQDVLIGMMDSVELAAHVVLAHTAYLNRLRREESLHPDAAEVLDEINRRST